MKAGGIAAFYCAARGDPSPTIVWKKNGKRVSGTQSRYLVQEYAQGGASLLRIEPVRAGRDDATYECVAENGNGDAVSADAVLTVHEGKSGTFNKIILHLMLAEESKSHSALVTHIRHIAVNFIIDCYQLVI